MIRITADELYEKLKRISVDNPMCTYTYQRCEQILPLINEILALKEEKNALILAHFYVHPDIVYGVADFVGDSYDLSKRALAAKEDTIVFPAVRFMAETAKILNPEKKVLDPNPNGGCTLADSITPQELHSLREEYPDHTFVCYINTTAAVKALCDVCVTSSNIVRILENLPTDKIYFLPDKYMGENAKRILKQKGVDKEVLTYPGACYVHEQFDVKMIDMIEKQHPDVEILAHPECKPEVAQRAGFIGSTTQMLRRVKEKTNGTFLILTECGVASQLNVEAPQAKIVGSCMLCRYMRSNSLTSIADALKNPREVIIAPSILENARRCIERMFEYAEK